jgi:hypothetical protein
VSRDGADCELMRTEIRVLQQRVATLEVRENARDEELLDIHRQLRLLVESLEGVTCP